MIFTREVLHINITIRKDPPEALKIIAASKDADAALLYALIAAHGGSLPENGGESIGFDKPRTERALRMLGLMGIVESGPRMPKEIPSPEPGDILETKRTDPLFTGICGFFEDAAGRLIRVPEASALLFAYRDLGLPADVLMLMIAHCKEKGILTYRTIERLSCQWHDEGVASYADAEALLNRKKESVSRKYRLMSAFGIADRKPSATEDKYLTQWAASDFSEELLKAAYDRTVLRTGKLQWSYMNRILENWKEKGIVTPEDISRLDQPQTSQINTKAEKTEQPEQIAERIFEKLRRDRENELERRRAEMRKDPLFADADQKLRAASSKAVRAELSGNRAVLTGLKEEIARLTALRAERLKAAGHGPDWLSIPPRCPHCQDRGFIGSRMCDCFKETVEKIRSGKLSMESEK